MGGIEGAVHKGPHSRLLGLLDVDSTVGLDEIEVARRRQIHGRNVLRRFRPAPPWRILIRQFKSLVMGLLAAAMLVALAFGDVIEAVAILVLLIINAGIGFTMEMRAVRSVEALRRIGQVTATVRRNGRTERVAADALVPGDIVLVEAGDVVTADMRLLTASQLQTDESTLTGESTPVPKEPGPLPEETILAERSNTLYKGTIVTRGTAECLVVGTGMATELGRITQLVQEAEDEATPLEERLSRLGRRLIYVTLAIVGVVGVVGILRGKPVVLMVEIAIALAVAAVPEGLPIVATLALARGVLRMARRNALVKRLSAVETLGSTSVIMVDKTGTLTENRMTVRRLLTDAGTIDMAAAGHPLDAVARSALEVGVLCNTASLSADGERSGDPMEVALLAAADQAALDRNEIRRRQPERRRVAFDPEIRLMATVHDREGRVRTAVKGAPEAVLAACDRIQTGDGARPLTPEDKQRLLAACAREAADGMRLLAVAERVDDAEPEDVYGGLAFLAAVALHDPPRPDVRASVAECEDAGIRVVMVTGDHLGTARAIGGQTGIVEDASAPAIEGARMARGDLSPAERERLLATTVFARVSPEQKLDLVALHQGAGRVVAMTGDGVNDAPALRKADIGVAMGGRGTEVAREASDLVLKDDAFPTIVEAVRQGRTIFTNIRQFAYYLLSCNVGEVAIVGLAALFATALPLLPLQILFLNLVTDVFPALALGFGEGDAGAMRRPPRPADEPFLTRGHWIGILGYGGVFSVTVLGAFFLAGGALGLDAEGAVTVSFLTLALAQLWHVFNMRARGTNALRNEVVRNPYVWGALVLCVGLLFVVVYVPALADVMSLAPLDGTVWAVVAVFSVIPLVAGQVVKAFVGGLE